MVVSFVFTQFCFLLSVREGLHKMVGIFVRDFRLMFTRLAKLELMFN